MNELIDHYSELFDYMYRYICVRVHDREAVADLVSDVFVIAWEKQSSYRPDKGSWRQWLTGIAKYRLLDHWRSRRVTIPLDDIELGAIPDYRSLDFDQLLNRLPANARQLLIWHYVDDLTYEDIAKLIKKKPPAIRQYFSRLHKQLQHYYEPN